MQITFLQVPTCSSLHPWHCSGVRLLLQHTRRARWLGRTSPESSTRHCDWHTKQWTGGSVGGKARERFLQSPDSAIKSQQGPQSAPCLIPGKRSMDRSAAPCALSPWPPPACAARTPINARICTSASPHPPVLWTSAWPFLQACRYFRSKAPHCQSANPCWFRAGLGRALRKGVTP